MKVLSTHFTAQAIMLSFAPRSDTNNHFYTSLFSLDERSTEKYIVNKVLNQLK